MTFYLNRLIIVVRPKWTETDVEYLPRERERELNDLILKIIRAVIHTDRAVRRMPSLSRESREENNRGYFVIVIRMWLQNGSRDQSVEVSCNILN